MDTHIPPIIQNYFDSQTTHGALPFTGGFKGKPAQQATHVQKPAILAVSTAPENQLKSKLNELVQNDPKLSLPETNKVVAEALAGAQVLYDLSDVVEPLYHDMLLRSEDPYRLISEVGIKRSNSADNAQRMALANKHLDRLKEAPGLIAMHLAYAETYRDELVEGHAIALYKDQLNQLERKHYDNGRKVNRYHPDVASYELMREIDMSELDTGQALQRLQRLTQKHGETPRLSRIRNIIDTKLEIAAKAVIQQACENQTLRDSAMADIKKEEFASAADKLSRFLEFEPHDYLTRAFYAHSLRRMGKKIEALTEARRAFENAHAVFIEKGPDAQFSPAVCKVPAKSTRDAEYWGDLIDIAKFGIEKFPDDIIYPHMLADAYWNLRFEQNLSAEEVTLSTYQSARITDAILDNFDIEPHKQYKIARRAMMRYDYAANSSSDWWMRAQCTKRANILDKDYPTSTAESPIVTLGRARRASYLFDFRGVEGIVCPYVNRREVWQAQNDLLRNVVMRCPDPAKSIMVYRSYNLFYLTSCDLNGGKETPLATQCIERMPEGAEIRKKYQQNRVSKNMEIAAQHPGKKALRRLMSNPQSPEPA